MKTLPLILAAGFCAGISAQTTLVVDPLIPDPAAAGLTFSTPGAHFFDLVVQPASGGITMHGLDLPCQSPVGTVGTIEVWINTSATTHIGIEGLGAAPAPSGDPSGWELLSSGAYVSSGFAVDSSTCQSNINVTFVDNFIPPGTWPMAITFAGVNSQFYGVTTYPAPAGSFSDANIEITNGGTTDVPWVNGTLTNFVFSGVNYPGCIADFGFTYSPGLVPHSCAEAEQIGMGSGTVVASFFDLLEADPQTGSPAPVSAALQGTALVLTNTSNGYIVSKDVGTFVAPSVNATSLTAVDDGEEQITLPNLTVPYPTDDGLGATTASLWVHSNGYVSFTGPNNNLFFAPVDTPAAMNCDGQTLFASYHDFNSTEVGSGLIMWEEDLTATPNPTLYITWMDVESYPNDPANPNPSRVQIQIDLVSGNIVVVYEVIDPVGGSTFAGGDDTLIGWTPAGESPVVTETDYTTLDTLGGTNNLALIMPEVLPLELSSSGQPTLGTPVDLVASNIPAGQPIGVIIVDTTLVNPPTPLFFLGAPMDAGLYVGALTFVFQVTDTAPQITVPVPVSPTVVGSELIGQAAWLDLGQLLAGNIFGNLRTSNAVRLKIGIF